MEQKLTELKARLQEIFDLGHINALLGWDQSTYMPPGGAAARGRQSALLGELAHRKSTDPELGKLIDALLPYGESLPYDSDDASLIRLAKREYENNVRVPAEWVAKFTEHTTLLYQTWAEARPLNDFAKVRPGLEKTLDFSRQFGGFFPGYEHIADPLIDQSDYGMKASSIRALFAELREQLVPIVQAITAQPEADRSVILQHFPQQGQLDFGKQVVEKLGYDFNRGRLDLTHHPFTTKFSLGDVRITTRVNEHDFGDALFSTIHEAGHAMYEQGIRMELEGTPLANGTSSGVHESQSRLWENVVGRSLPFWQHFYPELQTRFPDQLGKVPLEAFYRAINKVEKSLIRVDADEVTYNLHVMLRFDFELALLEGSLEVKDLPDAWRARFQSDLGLTPPDDKDGVMQDVHWYFGTIGGMFQGYTLGNILGAQFYDAAVLAHPEIPAEMQRGEFGTLHAWLVENIYQHGSKFTASELVQRAAGQPLTIEPYIRYLRTKYGQLYSL